MFRAFFAIIVVAIVAAFAIANYDQKNAPPQSKSPDHANTVVAASQLNQQWEQTFDKTGKYPERQDPSFHSATLGILATIPQDSTSYAEAQALKERMLTRQSKINKIEQSKRPPEPQQAKIVLGSLDSSYNSLNGDFTIQNPNKFPIADVQIKCGYYGASGTMVRDVDFTIYEVVPANGSKQIRKHRFGYYPDQAKSVSCSALTYQKR